MTKKLISLCSIFLILLTSIVVLLILDVPKIWIISTIALATIDFTWLIFSILIYGKKMMVTSSALLNNSENTSVFNFNNFDKSLSNQQHVAKKLDRTSQLISKLRSDDVDEPELTNSHDPIIHALASIRQELKSIQHEDEKRQWIDQGLAKFSEVLRKKSELKQYAYEILSQLIKYLNVNQGALFIVKEEKGESYLELAACYAYGKKKFLESKLSAGQGLVGQCMLEKDFVFLKEIPESYVKITSGLGEATPRNIIIAPLLFNEELCGVIEMASFEVLENHKKEFLKKVCESIASEIATIRNMEHTQLLLNESNSLAAELKVREEDMRKNLEDLAVAEREMNRKQLELSGVINAIDSTLGTAEFNVEGVLIKHNQILDQIFGFAPNVLTGKSYRLLTGNTNLKWEMVISGEITSGDYCSKDAQGNELWLTITFTVVRSEDHHLTKILCMIQDVTEKKIRENEFERLSLVANNTDNSVIITSKDGLIEYVNSGFTKMTGYTFDEVIGKKPGEVLQGPLTDQSTVEKLRDYFKSATPVYDEILNYHKDGSTYWVSLAINPVKDEAGNVVRFISIQANITETKKRALDFHQKMQALSRSNAILELDMKGNIIDINEKYLQLLGYTKEEVIGKSYSLLTKKEEIFEKVVETIKTNNLQSGVYRRFDKNGNHHFMRLMDYPVIDLNGEIFKIIEFGVDVSNEKRLENEKERKQKELDNYLAGINNTIATAEFAYDGSLLVANDIFLKVMGFKPDQISGKHIHFLMGDDPAVIMMWENLRLGKFFSGEFKMKSSAGRELWLTGTFNPVSIDGDKPEKIIMFAQFTTQEKEKLKELTALANAMKNTFPVLEFAQDFSCKTANEKAMAIFGLSRMQIRSKTILDFMASDYHLIWSKNKNSIIGTEQSNLIIPFIAGLQVVYYEVCISVTRNLEGEISKIIFMLVKEVHERSSILAVV